MNDITTLLPDIKLRFNIEHPSLEECYVYGYECALGEIGEEANPYRSGSIEHEQWQEGWWSGFYGDKPLFELSDASLSSKGSDCLEAANDYFYYDAMNEVLFKIMEITGILAVSAIVGYQIIDLVA